MQVNIDCIGPDRTVLNGAIVNTLTSQAMADPSFDFHKLRRIVEYETDDDGVEITNNYGRKIVKALCVNQYKGVGDRGDPKNYRIVNLLEENPFMVYNANASLTRNQWQIVDGVLQRVKDDRLVIIRDLRANNLVRPVDGLGHSMMFWQGVQSKIAVQRSMNAIERAPGAAPDFVSYLLPLPFIHADFDLDTRELDISAGTLGLEMVRQSGIAITEYVEDMCLTDVTYNFGGGTAYSFVNFPSRKTYTLPKKWTDSTITGELIVADVQKMLELASDDKFFGPFYLYIPSKYSFVLDRDYKIGATGYTGRTIRQRLLDLEGLARIVVADRIGEDNMVMIQMTPDNVELIEGMPIENVQWPVEGGFATKFKILTIMVLMIKKSPSGQCGVVHASK